MHTSLRQRLQERSILRVVGAHNGLGAKLIERCGFDAVWASGLEISTANALPDANILTMTENLESARAIQEATRLPVICDCDTGYGNATQVMHMIRRYEAAALAAVVIEDKRFPKVNSFIAGGQELVPIEEFAGKMEAARAARRNPDFLIFARVEALIAGFGMEEALRRAHAYVEAGADGIVIHSKAKSPEEVFTFARAWGRRTPLAAIPTTYPQVTAGALEEAGFSMVIYANQGLRAAIRAVEETLRTIAEAGSTAPVEKRIASLQEVFELQGLPVFKEEEKRFVRRRVIRAVIPAARDHRFQSDLKALLHDKPLCMLEVGGKTLLEHQTDLLRSCGVEDITVVGGFAADRIQARDVRLLVNPDYETTHCARSILLAREQLRGESVILYSDILLDRQILERLLTSPYPVTLVIDRAYRKMPHRDKPLDLAAVEEPPRAAGRTLHWAAFKPIRWIGQGTGAGGGRPTHEFIGLAYLNGQGSKLLLEAWDRAQTEFPNRPFYQAAGVERADFTNLIQSLIDRGAPVYGMEIESGWSEIHSLEDHRRVSAQMQSQETPCMP